MSDSEKVTNRSGPTAFKRWVLRIVAVMILGLVLAVALLYRYIVNGGLRARQTPAALETFVAQGLVNLSIPGEAKAVKNPLASSPESAAAAGRELYGKNCEVCHGFDGSGKTSAGGGLYPRPIDLRPAALNKRQRTDGELFYFIRNGIRNTGMPGWQFTDQQTWQLVSYIRTLPQTAALEGNVSASEQKPSQPEFHFVGSA